MADKTMAEVMSDKQKPADRRRLHLWLVTYKVGDDVREDEPLVTSGDSLENVYQALVVGVWANQQDMWPTVEMLKAKWLGLSRNFVPLEWDSCHMVDEDGITDRKPFEEVAYSGEAAARVD